MAFGVCLQCTYQRIPFHWTVRLSNSVIDANILVKHCELTILIISIASQMTEVLNIIAAQTPQILHVIVSPYFKKGKNW